MDLDGTLALMAAPIYAMLISKSSEPDDPEEMHRMMKRAVLEARALWLITFEKPWRDV